MSYEYDANSRVTRLVNGRTDGSIINQFSYTYDPVGNMMSRVDAAGTTSYSYDTAGRLSKYVKPDGTAVSYTYDGAGNRLTETTTDSAREYSYDAANRLLQILAGTTSTDFTYDANGNPLTDGQNSYTYDGLNRLIGVSGQSAAIYAYDGDGMRVQAIVGAATTNFYWDGDQVSLETDGIGATIARNLYGNGRIARILGPASSGYQATGKHLGYYLYDAHGDVKAITDPLGSVLAGFEYDPWGQLDGKTGTSTGQPS